MNWSSSFRRFSYPAFGLGLGLCAFSAIRHPAVVSESEEGYRRLWVSDSAAATSHLLKALQADPGSPERWLDYAEAMLASERGPDADHAIRQAVAAAPELVNIRLRAMNLSFRLGEREAALRHSAVVIRNSRDHWEPVFQAWSRLGGGADSVFRLATPSVETARAYFVWLTHHNGRPADTSQVWERLEAMGAVSRAETKAWVTYLIGHRMVGQAATVAARLRAADGNYLMNGGFEEPLSPGMPGWQVDTMAQVAADLTSTEGVGNSTGLRLRFSGGNPEYRHVTQRLPLNPGLYRLTGSLRAQRLTGRQGVALALTDVEQPSRNAVTASVSGDTNWTEVSTSMEVGPGPRLMDVAVIRHAGSNFESSAAGDVWLDNVKLVRMGDR